MFLAWVIQNYNLKGCMSSKPACFIIMPRRDNKHFVKFYTKGH